MLKELRQMPQEWRTVFVDEQSALPAHDLIAEENKLDNPRSKACAHMAPAHLEAFDFTFSAAPLQRRSEHQPA